MSAEKCYFESSYGQAICLTWLSFLDKSQSTTSIVILSLANSLSSCALVGFGINHLDLSPRFSGITFGILNASGLVISIVAPLLVQWTITDMTSVAQWRIVFMISVGFYLVGSTFHVIFASATRQPWDGPEDKELQERRKKVSVISFSGA